ncbi:hypothetical protein SR870_11210 [Rhodopseudomonas palustris]|uniref:hypothetical protein n=1 Tax=Rhodopseudomonas palustris TaxID=1076 RepID=UPI002ACD9AFD|nr:hypothetical protein [Rhodopseudomonas palustris]WQH01802.1 hypothetical protein SR870_11210 [Rhodopseudomonas palustris]
MWQPIGTENYDVQLELAVITDGNVSWSSGPCRRVVGGWVHCDTHEFVTQLPTHWRASRTACPFGCALAPDTPPPGAAPPPTDS